MILDCRKGIIMVFNSKIQSLVCDDKLFILEAKMLLNAMVDAELEKPDEDINFDLICDCTNAILILDSNEDLLKEFYSPSIKQIIQKADKSKLKTFKTASKAILIAALILATSITVYAENGNMSPIEAINNIVSSITTNNNVIKEENETTVTSTTVNTTTTTSISNGTNTQKKLTTEKSYTGKEKKKKTACATTTAVNTQTTVSDVNNASNQTTQSTTHKVNMETAQYMELCFESGVKKVYHVGEHINCSGMYVKIHYTDDYVTKLPVKYCTISGFDTSSVGDVAVTISYKNVSQSFIITVIE